MIVIQYGLAKSGSSFVFQLLTDILQNRFRNWSDYKLARNTFVDEKYHGDYIGISNSEVEELISLVPDYEFFLFKTHDIIVGKQLTEPESNELSNKVVKWLDDKKLKVIATVRDPRDMCLSYFDHAKAYRRGEKDFFDNEIHSAIDAVPNVKNEYKILSQWTKYKGIYWISYPQICNKPEQLLDAIKAYLGLYHIDSSKRLDELLNNKGKIHQFNKGIVDRWKKELSQEETAKLNHILKDEIHQYHMICKRAEFCINMA